MTHDPKPKVAFNPEFEALISKTIKDAVKESIPEPQKRSARLLEGAAIGVLVSALTYGAAALYEPNTAEASVECRKEQVKNDEETIGYQ